MPLTSPIQQFYYKTTGGMNNKVEDLELNEKFVVQAQNSRFESEPGAVTKRGAISYYNSSSIGTGAMIGLYRYYTKAGTIKSIAAHGSKIYVGDDSAGTWTEIRSLSTSGYRPSFVTYNDLLIGSNGQDDIWVYDGSSDNVTWELGACKAVASSGTGITKTSISYKITMDSDAYACGAVSNEIASVTNKNIALSNIPLGPSGTTNRKIYRKDSSTSGSYKLVTTLSNNTATTYTDNTDDISAGALAPSDTDDMPKGNILLVHRERLFLAGDPNNPNRVYYSNAYLPHYIQQTTNLDYMDVAKDDNDEITGLKIQHGIMMCIKKNTIRPLYVAAATSGADPTSWYAEDPVVFIGCPAQWSITQTPYGIVFLGWDSWYLFDGSSVKPIISQFDTNEILPDYYNNVIGHWSKDMFYAAYVDRVAARQYNDRVMVYNFAMDAWAYDTINVNAFSSHTGDDEEGELYYGDSVNGYVYKAEESDYWYKLYTKTQCNNGTKSTVFVGGRESDPYIEIGSTTSASAIPEGICILWDDDTYNPGAGWSEITGFTEKFIYISTTAGTSVAGSSHTHTISGTLAEDPDITTTNCGDGGPGADNVPHSHSFSGTSSSETSSPTYASFRVFSKNSSTTEYVFPDGAIVMWDQATAPDGWMCMDNLAGCYLRIDNADLGAKVTTTHSHTYSFASGADTAGAIDSSGGAESTKQFHTHNISGTTGSNDDSEWQLNRLEIKLIKKIGEESTWDGTSKYTYALYYSSGTPGAGWTEISSTYTGRYIKVGTGSPTTGSASDAVHDHTFSSGTSGAVNETWGSSGYHNQAIVNTHTHGYTGTVASGTSGNPAYLSFRLFKKILAQMLDYNSALVTHSSSYGIWTSPGLQINPTTLKNIFWNASLDSDTDSLTVFMRTGATQAAVENGTACTPDHTTDTFGATGHGMSNGDRVVISATVLPTGIVNTYAYYVVNKTDNAFQVSLTSGGSVVTFSSNGTTVTWKKWTGAYTSSSVAITNTPNIWVQYLIAFTATDTTTSNPQVYMSDGFVIKFNYTKLGTVAETAVEWIYDIGWRHFDAPMVDKIFKKLMVYYTGIDGSLTVYWETENEDGQFDIDLASHLNKWDSFFPSTAIGKKIKLKFYKNDVNDFTLKEIQGAYTPEPILI